MPEFKIVSDFAPAGDQPTAIAALAEGINRGDRYQTLLGITGSGKSATIAWTIEQVQRPTLVLAPNKALAAQLANEFRQFFPHNRVEYFVSYYDYYQPEAYLPQTDTYIEKDATINDEIDRLRHSATAGLLVRDDVIIVASVSAIYGLGSPEQYMGQLLRLVQGVEYPMKDAIQRLVNIQYERNEVNLIRGKFRVKGDTLEVFPSYEETIVRVQFWGDEVERIIRLNPVTGEVVEELSELFVFPATHYVTERERMLKAIVSIEEELKNRLAELEGKGKMLEAQRLRMRTNYDLEMMREVGFCSGIENYSRHLDGRTAGEAPYTLLDYFPKNYLTIIDESHVTVPQIGGQYEGDHSRKEMLVEHGFRLPSAKDNRPLRFDEWLEKANQIVFLSATPSDFEVSRSTQVVEQIIRPTGLIDPEVMIRPTKGQIDDLLHEIRERALREQRVLVTTLTKKMAEDLTDYLLEMGVRARYMHSEIDTLERVQIMRELRLGDFDVLVGINLLREGLDLPEVSLVAILDADKEGFLRSETSLIQIIGRAARNVDGQVVMYADNVTESMKRAINETNRRRRAQSAWNEEHGIDPQTVRKRVSDILELVQSEAPKGDRRRREVEPRRPIDLEGDDLTRLIMSLEDEMHEAAKELRFEYAARLRDEVNELKTRASRGRRGGLTMELDEGPGIGVGPDIREQPCVSIAVPLYNEEESISELLRRVSEALASVPGDCHQIVCVDDGSTDGTLDRLVGARPDYPSLKVVSLSRNFGHQAALSAAFEHATGDVVLAIDGDLQDDPAVLPRFIEEYLKGADVVYARRTNRPEGLLKRLAYSIHYRLLAMISESPIQLDSGDFALLSRRAVNLMVALPERQRYLRGLRSWIGLHQVGIDVDRHERFAGTSKYSWSGLASLAFEGIFAFSRVPLRLATILGIFTMLAGALYGLFVVISRFAGAPPQGFSTLALLQIGFSGALLLVLGVIGEYVGRIYEEVKRRPIYVVDHVWENRAPHG